MPNVSRPRSGRLIPVGCGRVVALGHLFDNLLAQANAFDEAEPADERERNRIEAVDFLAERAHEADGTEKAKR